MMAQLLADGQGWITNVDPLTGTGPHRVTLTIYDNHNKIAFSGRARVLLHRRDINGHGCGPIVWDGAVTASGRHSLTTN
jgi:hypothetical protein